MAVQVNGGIITDQMLKGKFSYYEIVGPFAFTVSGIGPVDLDIGQTGTVLIPDTEVEGGVPDTTYQFTVGAGKPVPGSAADIVLAMILEKCMISQIKLVATGTDGTGAAGTTTIQIAVENTSNAWNTTSYGEFDAVTGIDLDSDAVAHLTAAIVGGTFIGSDGKETIYPGIPDTLVPDTSTLGTTVSFAGVTVTEKEFLLA